MTQEDFIDELEILCRKHKVVISGYYYSDRAWIYNLKCCNETIFEDRLKETINRLRKQ